MLHTLIVHDPRLAIGGSLKLPVRVFCPKDYREAHLPNFLFMMVDMRGVRSFRSTPPRARRPPERYADSFVRNVPGGNQGNSRGPRKTHRRAKRRRNDSGGEGGRAARGAIEEVDVGSEEDDDVQILGVRSPGGRARIRDPPGSS